MSSAASNNGGSSSSNFSRFYERWFEQLHQMVRQLRLSPKPPTSHEHRTSISHLVQKIMSHYAEYYQLPAFPTVIRGGGGGVNKPNASGRRNSFHSRRRESEDEDVRTNQPLRTADRRNSFRWCRRCRCSALPSSFQVKLRFGRARRWRRRRTGLICHRSRIQSRIVGGGWRGSRSAEKSCRLEIRF
ncbi:hypothetical protein LINPERPRIM_LOCUS3914 [Linum perenne]